MKNRYIFPLLFSFVIAEECIDIWEKNNFFINNKQIQLNANINDSLIKVYYNHSQEKFRIETSEYILISDSLKTSKYMLRKNQLFIDKVDYKFNKHLDSFFDFKKLKRKIKKVTNNIYKMSNKLSKNTNTIYFDINCKSIDSLYIQNENYNLLIKNILIDSLYKDQNDSLFNLNINDKNVEIYDFR